MLSRGAWQGHFRSPRPLFLRATEIRLEFKVLGLFSNMVI